ncbi:MAG: cation-translocating P-type ATPase [Nitrospirota bacterium]
MADKSHINAISGLSEALAAERLNEEGYNELPFERSRGVLAIIFKIVREPMFLLLIAGGILYLLLGDIREALMLLAFVFVVIGITFYQERKTERTLEALRDLSSPRALVIRDGQEKRIAGREVVRGDILVLKEGDRVPADARVLSCINLSADESLSTGESIAVRKAALEGEMEICPPGGDGLPFVYSGTLIVCGSGIAEVRATGIKSEIGKIGKALSTVGVEETSLQKETGRIVKILAVAGLSLCAAVITVYGLTRGNWLHGLLAGITLAMAILPEELPVILVIFLALGAWRISQKQVLTRRTQAIETLGAATVLCVDKTGTITQNRMTVSGIYAGGECHSLDSVSPLPENFHELVEFGILASQTDPFDPMEKAIRRLGETSLAKTEHLHGDWTLVQEYPLSEEMLSLSHVWKSPDGTDFIIAAKGAPESIADLCHFTKGQTRDLLLNIDRMTGKGLRVIGVAKASFRQAILPARQHDFGFEFIGLIGLSDPVRPMVAEAVKNCYGAGIRVVMITGDYPGTARNIASEIGLVRMDCITGPELDGMTDGELRERIKTADIFARVVPEQKLRLVGALKADGEIVAMTGDGVNDAPALKSAHIGIAMGERGTDVARESADLVLLDDDFSSIVKAVRLGRRIFDNIKKAVSYATAVHVPIAGMALIPVLLKWPLVLLPVHILFLELIIDPACSIVFEAEPEESGIMDRPPRNQNENLFGRKAVLLSALQGLSVLAIVFGVYYFAMVNNRGEDESRALSFTTLIVANLALILTNRSWSRTVFQTLRTPNAALWWVLSGAIGFLALVLSVPFLRGLFKFSELGPVDLLVCFAAGMLSIAWFEALKVLGVISPGGQKVEAAQT